MGLHAHILEYGRRSPQLLSLNDLLGQPCTLSLSLEPDRSDCTLRFLSSCLLGVGYGQRPKEPIQAAGTWYAYA